MAQLKNITATGQVIDPEDDAGRGVIYGVIVNNHSSGTLRLVDSPGGASGENLLGNATNSYTFPSGDQVVTFPRPINFHEGVYAEVGGTLDCDLIWSPKTD